MITCIREVRRTKGLTLQEVADRCSPPTTAQTIGRLETGTRTVSVGWLNRIADALGVAAADLVRMPERADIPVVALIGASGARAPSRERVAVPPQPAPGLLALLVETSCGDYRAGDEVWAERITPEALSGALNRDLLVPAPAGRYLFGRLIGCEDGAIQLLPLTAGARAQTIDTPPWAAVASRLIRPL
jgi:transcriptional regulator with XRE-family HTH domain